MIIYLLISTSSTARAIDSLQSPS
uniref:Cysteine proteinase inhibitor n=1 Tax=Rhizophora mucronata TaxID=61149 RepID=A0A2P2R3I2_RHIMU